MGIDLYLYCCGQYVHNNNWQLGYNIATSIQTGYEYQIFIQHITQYSFIHCIFVNYFIIANLGIIRS